MGHRFPGARSTLSRQPTSRIVLTACRERVAAAGRFQAIRAADSGEGYRCRPFQMSPRPPKLSFGIPLAATAEN